MVDTGRIGSTTNCRPYLVTGNKMIHGGKKFEKTQKSKFKEKSEKETFRSFRNKHKDKQAYRLQKQEVQDDS